MQDLSDSEFRNQYGKVLSFLVTKGFSIENAEDAVSQAWMKAHQSWQSNPPENSLAWLCTVAYRNAIGLVRKQRHTQMNEIEIEVSDPEFEEIKDERIRLFAICTHPAIDSTIQTVLILQLVFGMDAQQLGQLFMVPSATIAQRLVRAKRKIHLAGIQPEIISVEVIRSRLTPILESVYGLYCRQWLESEALIPGTEAATELAQLMTELFPNEPECIGLLALMAFIESRQESRIGSNGELIPFEQQEVHLWNSALIHRAEALLHQAAKHRRSGRFQIEAALQSAHIARRRQNLTEWTPILRLYQELLKMAPTEAYRMGYVAATAQANGAEEALKLLTDPEAPSQQFYALRAHLAKEVGDLHLARQSAERALEMATTEPERKYLKAFLLDICGTIES